MQELILGAVARMVGLPQEQIQVAIDGCGAPVFYVPLKNIALGYARLAGASRGRPREYSWPPSWPIPGTSPGTAAWRPTVMEALPGKIFAKSGAEGGYGLSLTEGGLGVAFKIEDGSHPGPQPHGGGHPGATGGAHPGGPGSPGRLPGAAHPQPPPRRRWAGSGRPLRLTPKDQVAQPRQGYILISLLRLRSYAPDGCSETSR